MVWLGDLLGEMPLYYGLADLCLLGGSFEPLGGQNLIEAAACSCPVVMAPHTFNFAQASEQAIACGAAQRVKDISQALALVERLSQDAATLETARESCMALSQQRRGAVDKTVTAVAEFLSCASS